MKVVVRVLAGAVIAAVLVVGVGAAWVALSPMPVVYLLRHGFGEDEGPKVPADYQAHAARVTVERDCTYPSEHGRNTYDLYLPRELASGAASSLVGAARKAPVVVWAHGGAFVAGDKSGLAGWATMLASEGYAVAAVNYEWAPEISYPGQVRQIEECVGELKRREAAGTPLDMGRVVFAGDSAGAHIVAQAGLLATNPTYRQEIGVSSELPAEAVKGMLLMCGPYDVAEIAKVDNSLVQFFVSRIGWAIFGTRSWQGTHELATTTIKDYVTAAWPPSFITDGNNVSFEREGKALAQTLRDLGVRCDTLFWDTATSGKVNHEYQMDLTTPEGQTAYTQELAFLRSVLP